MLLEPASLQLGRIVWVIDHSPEDYLTDKGSPIGLVSSMRSIREPFR